MKHILWDMGGTLIDTYPDVDITLARAIHGNAPSRSQLREVSRLTRVSTEHAVKALAARYGQSVSGLRRAYDELKEHWKIHPAPVMDGARDVMASVHSAGKLNLIVTHRDRASATTLLTGHGLEPDDMVCAPDGLPRKPDPAMFHLMLNRHGVRPADAIAIGDRAIDGEAAHAAGIEAILLVTPGIDVDSPAARTITNLRELLA